MVTESNYLVYCLSISSVTSLDSTVFSLDFVLSDLHLYERE